MQTKVFKCDGPECSHLSETAEGWTRQEMEPYGYSGLPPYCEMVAPEAKSGFDMLFIYLIFCSADCQRSWWVRHQRDCRCHTRYMQVMVKLPPEPRCARGEHHESEYLYPGEVTERFGVYKWPQGAEWVCGRCKGPVEDWCGESYCKDPICHAETEPLRMYI